MSGRDHWKQAASFPSHTKRQDGRHTARGNHSVPYNGSHSLPDNGAHSVLDNDIGAHPVPHKRGPTHRGVRYAGDGAHQLVLIVQTETWPRLRPSISAISFDLFLLTTQRGWCVHTRAPPTKLLVRSSRWRCLTDGRGTHVAYPSARMNISWEKRSPGISPSTLFIMVTGESGPGTDPLFAAVRQDARNGWRSGRSAMWPAPRRAPSCDDRR